MTARIAFATSNGAVVDQHFGRADRFEVWDVGRTGSHRVEGRLALGPTGQLPGVTRVPAPAHAELPNAVSDCVAVFAAQIGQGAVAALARAGKRAFVAPGRIDQIVRQISASPLLDDLERSASYSAGTARVSA
jgi:predicted Fe-Mo cluster-binding NifX family protein